MERYINNTGVVISVNLNSVIVPYKNTVKYFGMTLNVNRDVQNAIQKN